MQIITDDISVVNYFTFDLFIEISSPIIVIQPKSKQQNLHQKYFVGLYPDYVKEILTSTMTKFEGKAIKYYKTKDMHV
jgi:hypothetical protein